MSPVADTLQLPGPLHAPPQPAKLEPASACAVSDTALPPGTVIAHALGQSMPAGDEVMWPVPLPTGWTLTRAAPGGGGGAAENEAVTSWSALIARSHPPVPVQAPAQPTKESDLSILSR